MDNKRDVINDFYNFLTKIIPLFCIFVKGGAFYNIIS